MIIPIIFFIIYIFCFYIVMTYEKKDVFKDSAGIVLFMLFLIFFLISLIQKKELENCNKCPEYEKIENVYKLKQK